MTEIRFKYSRKQCKIAELSKTALKAKLYRRGRYMRGIFLNPQNTHVIVVGFYNEKPIAAATISDLEGFTNYLMVFVRSKYRKRGIGKKISQLAIKWSKIQPGEIKASEKKKDFFLNHTTLYPPIFPTISLLAKT